MQKYVICDNHNNIYDIANTEIEIRQKLNDSKLARIMEKATDNHIEFSMGLAELTEDELKEFELDR